MAGVRAVFSGEGKNRTVTTWAKPKVSGDTKIAGGNNIVKKTFYNFCPNCGRWGSLHFVVGHSCGPEGTLVCGDDGESGSHSKTRTRKGCDMDFSCVSGYETSGYKKRKLRPATVTPNSISKVAASQTQSQKCSLSKAEALTKAKEGLKDKSTYKGTLKIPLLQNIRAGDLVGLQLPGFDKGTYYIDSIKEDIDNQTYELALLEGANHLTTKYKGDSYLITDSKGRILNTGSSNPLQAKCSNVNVNIGLKDNTRIGKKIRLKGQELGTVDKIYQWLRIKSGGGRGGWKYVKYMNHYIKSESEKKFGPKSAEKCWKAKKANCTDFAWIMAMMGKGAGKKIGIRCGTYTNPGDKTRSGHMWNYCGVKNYDCSSASTKSIEWMDIEEVKTNAK